MPPIKRISSEILSLLIPFIIITLFTVILIVSLNSTKLDAESIALSAQSLIQAGEYDQALEQWQYLLDEHPDNALAAYQSGLLSLLQEPSEAAAYFNRAASLDPTFEERSQRFLNRLRLVEFTDDPAYKNIQVGQALAAEDEWQLALDAFSQAAEANPMYAEAWAFLGEAQFQLGRDGLPALVKAVQLDPKSLAANIFMGAYWQGIGQPESALPYLQTAVEFDPNNPSLLSDYGFTLAAVGDIPAAMEQFKRIADIAPDDLETWTNIAQFSLDHDLQVSEIGLPAARQAVLLAPDDPQTLVLLARVYSQQGDNLVALRFFKQALELNPGYAPAHYYLGLHYLSHDSPQLAQEELQKTIDMAGDSPLAVQAEKILVDYFNSHPIEDER
jgi:tetratricopeptide (TPR) repeat protein